MSELPEPGGGGMERRAIVATVLALAVLIIYQFFFMPTPPPPPEPKKEEVEETKPAPAPLPEAPKPVPKAPRISGPLRRGEQQEDIVLETDLLRVTLTNRGGGVRSWQLRQYEDEAGFVDLAGGVPEEGAPLPLTSWVEGGEGDTGLYRVLERPATDRDKPQRVVMEFQEADGTLLEKTVTLYPGRYLADVDIRLKSPGGTATSGPLRLQWGPGFRLAPKRGLYDSIAPDAWIDGSLASPSLEKGEEEIRSGRVSWAAIRDGYFAAALIAGDPGPSTLLAMDPEGRPFVGLIYPAIEIPAGGEATIQTQLYAGPKEITRLRDAGHNLRELVDLGWFDFVARPALYLLRFLYGFLGNYGVAIIIITIVQKIAFYPLTQKSHKSMQAMQMLQPKLQALKDKYKNNPQKVQQETMELYKRYGVNPFGGCLPMLIQIPIFIALYNALASSVELWRAPFTLWINDLSVPDTLFVLPFALPYLGEAFPFRGLPLIMGVSMFIQQKMSPTGGDPRQAQMMLYMMPVMFTFIFWGMPSGLVLYWLVNNVLQIGHQYHMNRAIGLSLATGKEEQ